MKKKQVVLILILTLLGFLIILGGALAKLEHFEHSNYILFGGMLLQFITALLAIYFVLINRKSKKSIT